MAQNLYWDGPLPLVKKGKYAECKCYIRTYDSSVLDQVSTLVNCPAFKGQSIYLMPDAHVGKSGPCGLASTVGDYINPDHVGGDIGCTVSAIILDKQIPEEKYTDFEHKVKVRIPMGPNIHENQIFETSDFLKFLTKEFNKYRQVWPEMLSDLPNQVTEKWIDTVLKRVKADAARFWKSLGTIGGGNHFLEYDLTKDGKAAFFCHFGSRRFGQNIYQYWRDVAKDPISKSDRKKKEKELIEEFKVVYKAAGKDLRKFKEEAFKYVNEKFKELEIDFINGYLKGDNLKKYLQDMCFAQLYAKYNHMQVHKIISNILKIYNVKVVDTIFTTHNFIDLEDRTLRKSSIRAKEDEIVIIPFSMKDGVVIAKGLGNQDWGESAPHGAGRVMSRKEAKDRLKQASDYTDYLVLKEEFESDLPFSDEKLEAYFKLKKEFESLEEDQIKNILSFSLDSFKKEMEGIVTTSVCENTIDESPMAYKDTKEIESVISGATIEEIDRYFPVINWKDTVGEDQETGLTD